LTSLRCTGAATATAREGPVSQADGALGVAGTNLPTPSVLTYFGATRTVSSPPFLVLLSTAMVVPVFGTFTLLHPGW
jgi:hypothetical protein